MNVDSGAADEQEGRAARFRALRHELRTPINHIVGYGELLLESAADWPPAARAALAPDLEKVVAAGKDVLERVNTFFDAAHAASPPDLAAVGHDLRDPLTAIIGYADLLRDEAGEQDLPDVLPDLERIGDAGRTLLSLVDGFVAGGPHPATRSAGPRLSQGRERGGMPNSPAPVPGRGAGGEGAIVLVVDDDALNRDLLARWLARLGHRVECAENGWAALERLRAAPVDLVLLDVMMPVMDGYAVLQEIRADEAFRGVPVIVLSASAETASAVRCITLGAADFLPKPFDPVLLRARVGACLEQKRLRDREQAHLATIGDQAAQLAAWNRTLEARVREQVAELERLSRLRRFLSPSVAEIVASGGEELLKSHRRQVAALFCDLRGSTAFSENAEPEEAMAVFGAYHQALGELIYQFDGTIDHRAGDGMMVVFNDPLPCADPARRAVELALAMRARLDELRAGWRKRGHEMGFAVGVSLGYATLGLVGYEGRFDYMANGSVVVLAARLCAEAEAGQIVVSQRVVGALDAAITVEALGELPLKGFPRPVPAFNVLGLRAAPAATVPAPEGE